ncbi:MAG: efflux transporter outer membrane subunit [Campylobacteraceae bacterium]|jgi:multidrug efflux system outer membrane protein|nr:efflux transporter outer membrane subunit [Campylobacteraceae bacterium]
MRKNWKKGAEAMNIKLVSLPLLALIISGCSLSPKLDIKSVESADIQISGFNVTNANSTINQEWWKEYNDEALNSLVDEALNNNKDFEIALLNISLSRASLALKEADLYPSLSAKGGGARTETSEEAYTSGGRRSLFNDFSLSAILNYEVDLWGRVRLSNEAAKAALLSSEASADAIRLSLASSVVDSYFVLVSLKEQLAVTEDTIKTREQTLELTKIRFEEGADRESTMVQQQSLLTSAKITKNNIEQQIAVASSALGILLGRDVKDLLAERTILLAVLPNDIDVPTDIPSSILENRPDVEASLQQLISSNELIGVARAAYFPSLSLSGLFGLDSADAENLIKSSASTWNIGVNLAAPLIDFGRTGANVDIAAIQKDINALNYEKTVLNAFREVYNALASRSLLELNHKNALDYEADIARTLELVRYEYEAGNVNFLSVLDAERSLLSAKLARIQTHQALLSSGVSLFKALGGGWTKGND